MELEFFKQFFKKCTQILNFTKVRPVGAHLFHADRRMDGWTDMTNLCRGHPVVLMNRPSVTESYSGYAGFSS